ncbi:class I SAM-dependent methyltransferase [Luteimonas sp. Sa2BVA3]|uniref:Class I SAM-dependent methyltransferase n=1 Tax=Luteimonas colneyensis TaxID=2762230 RepID=A0ABR8UGF7_9GAMM|nr:methyltransferase domain-containing protein [Luteimonas colneyensis]MBD7987102.1 class I SAM-dependent methyltransferase [Luteimonas colneyensis]
MLLTRQSRALQRSGDAYWKRARDTYHAPPEFYAERERALREILGPLGEIGLAIDVGCGDGRYSRVIAEYAELVQGFDISPSLISRARAAGSAGNVEFSVGTVAEIASSGMADLVTCMGVTSCIVDPVTFDQSLSLLRRLLKPSGSLLMIDTLSTGSDMHRAYRSGYVARYRARSSYERAIQCGGLEIVREMDMAMFGGGLVNRMYLLRKHASHSAQQLDAAG